VQIPLVLLILGEEISQKKLISKLKKKKEKKAPGLTGFLGILKKKSV
jgi:hypothetical protein